MRTRYVSFDSSFISLLTDWLDVARYCDNVCWQIQRMR